MKSTIKQSNKKGAFTIIELLTVMSIIVILIGLLVPAMNKVRQYARMVKQKNQFHSIGVAIELFNAEQDGYPPSSENGDYCGSMKLCEAIMGQDLLGFHPDSRFTSDAAVLYPPTPDADNLKTRKGPYLLPESANAYRLEDLYSDTGPYKSNPFVLCDVYTRVIHKVTGKRIGMPILYYTANTSKTGHSMEAVGKGDAIYDYHDNHELVARGLPWEPPPGGPKHKLFEDPETFYTSTLNDKIAIPRPCRSDTYILLSAGFDGEYGTGDDVFNFDR